MKLLIIAIGWILGIIIGLYLNISIAFLLCCLFLTFFVFLIIYRNIKVIDNNIFKKMIINYIILVITIIISIVNYRIIDNNFEFKYKNINNLDNNEIIGVIISDPIIKDYKVSYIVDVKSINNDCIYKNTKILLNVKSKKCELKYGDKIKTNGILETPNVARNEGGFNYKDYLKGKGIYKIVSVKKDEFNVINDKAKDNIYFFDFYLHFIKVKIKSNIYSILPEKEANFIIGIILGDKINLDEEIVDNFRESSLSHIIAISGMHVSYIIVGIYFLFNICKINKKSIKIIIVIFLFLFCLLTGSTPSVERACLMSSYMLIGNLIYKKVKVINSICFSSIIILIINPYALFDLGFQLSFGGTIGIVFLYPIFNKLIIDKIKNKVGNKNDYKKVYKIIYKLIIKAIEISFVTISANIIIMPILISNFNTVSSIFVISNLIITPFIGLVFLLGIVCICISFINILFAGILSIFLKLVIDIIFFIVECFSNLTFNKFYVVTPKIIYIFIYYLFVFYLILDFNKIIIFKKKWIKVIIVCLLLISLICDLFVNKLMDRDLKIYFVDVGQRRL